MKRTPKEWSEPCGHCSGTGTVHKKQRFSLWTPEEYGSTREPHPDQPEGAYACTAVPGAEISTACEEAVEIAKAVDRTVAFVFNGVLVVAQKDSVPVMLRAPARREVVAGPRGREAQVNSDPYRTAPTFPLVWKTRPAVGRSH